MRSIGDHRWLNQYIGLPYLLGGRGREGLDCFGLCALVYREQYEEELPDWLDDDLSVRARAATIEKAIQSGTWQEVEEPQDGDFVVCYRTRAAHHLGLFFAGGVLHAVEGRGVVFEPVARFIPQYTDVVFGEWHP